MRTSPSLAKTVRRLKESGLSYYAISGVTGLARSTCARLCGVKQRAGKRTMPKGTRQVIEAPDMSVIIWCDECKANVHPPCVACHVRRILAAKRVRL